MKRVVRRGREKRNNQLLPGLKAFFAGKKIPVSFFAAVVFSIVTLTCLAGSAKKLYRAVSVDSLDWGLYYESENQVPRGNEDKAYLAEFDAFFTGDTTQKVLYLTFDAGYEAGYTDEILAVLQQENVPAAFFLVGHYFDSAPDLAVKIAEAGHIIGNHSYSHPDMSVAGKEAFLAELNKLNENAKAVAGRQANRFYRPPAGKYSEENLTWAKQAGYKTVFWSVTYADWDKDNQKSDEEALKTLNSRLHNGAIILLHATSETNARILQRFIAAAHEAGYTFVSLDTL